MNGKLPLPLFPVTESNHSTPEVFFSNFFKKRETDLVGCGPIQLYPSATEIFHEDAPGEVLYLIERGLVKLSRIGPNGSDMIVGLRSRYWLLAAPDAVLKIPYSFTATTLTPCHLRSITARCFFHLLKTDEVFSWEMYRQLSQLIITNLNKVVEVSRMSASERMRNFLCQLIAELSPEKAQTHNQFQVPLKHHELAEIIGVSSEYLSRLVKNMEKQGFIVCTKGMLTIQDVSSLSS
jgi:CRP-like cAMP-binding protein